MPLHEYYTTMTPVGYFAAVIAAGFFGGLFLGWLLWWWGARQYDQTRLALREAKSDADALVTENERLENLLQSREARSGHPIKLNSHSSNAIGAAAGTAAAGTAVVGLAGAALAIGGALPAGANETECESEDTPSEDTPSCDQPVDISNVPETDWNSLDGMSPKAASILTAMEIKTLLQLDQLPPATRDQLDSTFKAKGIHWDWNKVDEWKHSFEPSLHAVGGPVLTGAEIIDSDASGTNINGTSAIDGGADGARINVQENVAATASVSASSGSLGLDWNSIEGVSPKAAGILHAMEIQSLQHLKELSPAGKLQLDSTFKTKGVDWDWSIIGASETSLTVADSLSPEPVADQQQRFQPDSDVAQLPERWASVAGVNRKAAAVLDAMEISGFEQLVQLQPDARKDLAKHMSTKEIPWDWDLIDTQASSLSSTRSAACKRMTSRHANMSGPAVFTSKKDDPGADRSIDQPTQRPVLATEIPRFKDDLTLLDGIGSVQAEELHRMGIHNFDQLHDLTPEDQSRLSKWFEAKSWALDFDQWRIASEGNTLNPTLEQIQNKAFEVFQHRDANGLHGAENTDWEQAEWELRGNPIFGYGVPHHVDDFDANHANLTGDVRDELYRMGLYNFDQIAALDSNSRRMLASWFAGPRFGVDITSAFGWLSSMSSVPTDRDYGLVYWNPPEQIDDLTEIDGIGPAVERQLNRIGVFQFSQIAAWSPSNIEAVSETLELGDRIDSEAWLLQARKKSEGSNGVLNS